MPGLVMFGRRWGFGSDDLAVTTVVIAVLHTVWYVNFSMPNTHRRRRRDSTVELRRVGVGGVNTIRN